MKNPRFQLAVLRALLWLVQVILFKWLVEEKRHWRDMRESLYNNGNDIFTELDRLICDIKAGRANE